MEWASTLSANRDPRTFGWMVKNHNDVSQFIASYHKILFCD